MPQCCLVAALSARSARPCAVAQPRPPPWHRPRDPRGTAATPTKDRGRDRSPTGRWIVVLKDGASVDAAARRAPAGLGVAVDRTFSHVVHGYSAKLDASQFATLRADPNVEALVPDGVISARGPDDAARRPPRVRATQPDRADRRHRPAGRRGRRDRRHRHRQDHPDLNVVGGVNCSTSNRAAWDDGNGHGTHVAGIVGAIDNGIGVVGVAPGVRLWAVRILNSGGSGLVSWYVCGLDWITAQRDPADPSRPLIEAANMSVAKTGSDDHNCGLTNHDPMHQAVCRLVAVGRHGGRGRRQQPLQRVAAWSRPSYNEVITVSALADSDGSPAGWAARVLLVGHLRQGRHVRRLLNYGPTST